MENSVRTFELTGPSEGASLKTLVPYSAAEAISVGEAAAIAGKSERTIRNWCVQGIGRRIGDGAWAVSKVALTMWLEGDGGALAAYRDGARGSWEPVAKYYRRCGLAHLLERPEFAV
jgi:hypothetical protein